MQAKWWKILLGTALTLLLISGCGAGTDEQGPEDGDPGDTGTEEGAPAEEGGDTGDAAYDEAAAQEAYQTGGCASCHGGNLEGSAGPSLEQAGANYSQEEIVDIINNGIGQMPPQGDNLDDDAKQNLAAWLADQK